jgi:hypothetical protein
VTVHALAIRAPGMSSQEFDRHRRKVDAPIAANVPGVVRDVTPNFVDESDDCVER